MLPIRSSRRKDICGNAEICHPVLFPLVSCFCGRKLFVQNWSPLGNNKKKIPNYKVRCEVIFHPGLASWGNEQKNTSKRRKCYRVEEALSPRPLKVLPEFPCGALGCPSPGTADFPAIPSKAALLPTRGIRAHSQQAEGWGTPKCGPRLRML